MKDDCICVNDTGLEALVSTETPVKQQEIANNTGCNQSDILVINGAPLHCTLPATLLQLGNKAPQLKQLSWHNTGLSELFNYTFASLVQVEHLNLSGNVIDSIDADAFKHLLWLSMLDLSHNRIEALPATVFSANSQLTHIWLRQNSLTMLELSLTSRALMLLDVAHNQLAGIELRAPGSSQKRIGNGWQRNHNNLTIRLDENRLTSLLLSGIQVNQMSVRHNGLRDLEVFGKLKPFTIESLDLEDNRLG